MPSRLVASSMRCCSWPVRFLWAALTAQREGRPRTYRRVADRRDDQSVIGIAIGSNRFIDSIKIRISYRASLEDLGRASQFAGRNSATSRLRPRSCNSGPPTMPDRSSTTHDKHRAHLPPEADHRRRTPADRLPGRRELRTQQKAALLKGAETQNIGRDSTGAAGTRSSQSNTRVFATPAPSHRAVMSY